MKPSLLWVVCALAAAAAAGQDPARLPVVSGNYPRAFFFRETDLATARGKISYPHWEATFSRLMGIEGKVLDEEIPGCAPRNLQYFTRFKQQHPEQLVLLHYNGTARDPRDAIERFSPGHWLYYTGARILGDVPAQSGEAEIRVDRPELFRTGVGRFRNADDDLGLCELDAAGRPDWNRSEQVQLLAVDPRKHLIRVRRGCYGSVPRAFAAGKSYAAAHVSEGPWGRDLHLLWLYNYSTASPRDAAGHTCGAVLADELAAHFAPGGKLQSLDGLEFDELNGQLPPAYRRGGRGPDYLAAGPGGEYSAADATSYGVGIIEFCRLLRQRLGPHRLILADGWEATSQRAFGILNGVESEGWPANIDWEIRDWSGGLNRLQFWSRHAYPPVFNYIAHKYVATTSIPGQMKAPEIPMGRHRLVFAVAMFTDSAVCYVLAPPRPAGGMYGIWDELQKGTEHQLGWLGKPLGPAVRMARRASDALAFRSPPQLLARLRGSGLSFSQDGDRVKIVSANPQATQLQFRLLDVPAAEPDLLATVTMQGDPLRGNPPEMARLAWCRAAAPDGTRPETAPRFMTWVGQTPFDASFYFSDVASKTIDLEWTVEGSAPLWISGVHVYQAADAIYREFEHGLVLANPSPRPYSFDLETLVPGGKFRRLHGSPEQDLAINNGQPVSGPVVLGAKEGLFLVRQ